MSNQDRSVFGKAFNPTSVLREVLDSTNGASGRVLSNLPSCYELHSFVVQTFEQLLGNATRSSTSVQQSREGNSSDVHYGLAIIAGFRRFIQNPDHTTSQLSETTVGRWATFRNLVGSFGIAVKKRSSAFFDRHEDVFFSAGPVFFADHNRSLLSATLRFRPWLSGRIN